MAKIGLSEKDESHAREGPKAGARTDRLWSGIAPPAEPEPKSFGKSIANRNPLQKLRALLSPRSGARPTVTEDHILSVLAYRRGREAAFGRDLFSDPAWDLLLELYAARLAGRSVTLAELATAIDIPRSTSARWINALVERGLIITTTDSVDCTQLRLDLSPDAAARMKRLMDYWGSAFRSI